MFAASNARTKRTTSTYRMIIPTRHIVHLAAHRHPGIVHLTMFAELLEGDLPALLGRRDSAPPPILSFILPTSNFKFAQAGLYAKLYTMRDANGEILNVSWSSDSSYLLY